MLKEYFAELFSPIRKKDVGNHLKHTGFNTLLTGLILLACFWTYQWIYFEWQGVGFIRRTLLGVIAFLITLPVVRVIQVNYTIYRMLLYPRPEDDKPTNDPLGIMDDDK